MFRPLCLPDEYDLNLDLPVERTGTVVGWGLDTVFYKETRCDYVKGESDSSSLPTTLKKAELKCYNSFQNEALINYIEQVCCSEGVQRHI